MRDAVVLLRCVGVLALLAGCASSASRSAGLTPDVDPRDPLAGTRLMEQGQALVNEGRIADGLARYRVAEQLQPKNPTVHNLIGVAELKQRNSAKAIESFNRALALAPQYSDARNNRGAAYVQLGQLSMAEADFLAVLSDSTHANRASVHFNLGSLYYTRGDMPAAEENLRRAAVPSGPIEAFLLLGQVEEALGKQALAETAYRTGIARAPERPDLALALGKILEGSGRKDEAREMFRRVVSLAPDSPEAQQARSRLE
jgi:tetratricopeptide (TPR) repeat protein